MSKYLGVITWNVRGDLSTSDTADLRRRDLNRVLTDLANNQEHPVDFICLQETSGNAGALKSMLEGMGYTCYVIQEGRGEGDYYVFATSPNSGFSFDGPPGQCLFQYQSSSGSPLRYPAVAKLTRRSDNLKVALYTYHASLNGGRLEGLQKCSAFAAATAQSGHFNYVLVAGDLNVKEDEQVFDSSLGRNVYIMRRLFQDFTGVSENLDYVLCRSNPVALNLRNCYGFNYETSSDHALLYGRFEIG